MGWLRSLFARILGTHRDEAPPIPPHLFSVGIADGEITSLRPDGVADAVRLADLRAVLIETGGPARRHAWWLLVGENAAGCVFPHGATGEDAVVTALRALPGFDAAALERAAGATANARFLCWQRAATRTAGGRGVAADEAE